MYFLLEEQLTNNGLWVTKYLCIESAYLLMKVSQILAKPLPNWSKYLEYTPSPRVTRNSGIPKMRVRWGLGVQNALCFLAASLVASMVVTV